MNKIVVDTNIFLSALFSKDGSSFVLLSYLLDEAKKGNKLNYVSVSSILELQEVVFRPKNRSMYDYFSDDDLNSLIDSFVLISNRVNTHYLWRPFLKDTKDDKILETAVNANVDYIVTYNLKDFEKVEKYFGIKIVKPNQILEVLK